MSLALKPPSLGVLSEALSAVLFGAMFSVSVFMPDAFAQSKPSLARATQQTLFSSVQLNRQPPPGTRMTDVTQSIAAPSTQDAIALVKDDHKSIRVGFEALLAALTAASSEADVQGLLSRLALRLRAHSAIEVELLYPALHAAIVDAEAAIAEHAAFERTLERLAAQQAPWPDRAQTVEALAGRVLHHFDDEERGLLARAPSAGVDLLALGTQMAVRRGELLADLGTD